MKTAIAIFAGVVALAGSANAAPVTFGEVSLLVRMGEAEGFVTGQVAERRLLRALTPGQVAALRAQGASDALLETLRKPEIVLSADEAVAFEKWSAEQRVAVEKKIAEDAARHESMLARQAAMAERQLEESRARAVADAAAAEADVAASYSRSYDYGYAPYYPVRPIGPRPGHGGHPGKPGYSATSLNWNNGTTTTYTQPGLYYHAPGANGSGASHPQPSPTHGKTTSFSIGKDGGKR